MSNLHSIAAGLAVVCFIGALGSFAFMHVREPQIELLADPVSYLALGASARPFVVYGVLGSLGTALLAVAMFLSPPPGVSLVATASLSLSFLLRLGAVRFKTGRGQWTGGREGRLHLLFAALNFACVYTAVANASSTLALGAPGCMSLSLAALYWAATISLVALVTTMIPRLRSVFGLCERAFILTTLLWLALAAFRLA